MTEDIHYTMMIDQAMRGVVREVLKQVQSSGLPGEHHFYVSFATNHPGVRISELLKSKYPKEMTIVLQHQFWDFKVEEQLFTATLSFNGIPEKLIIPYAALTAFADPSVKFGLQFQQPDFPEAANLGLAIPQDPVSIIPGLEENEGDDNSAEIISLDSFRKK